MSERSMFMRMVFSKAEFMKKSEKMKKATLKFATETIEDPSCLKADKHTMTQASNMSEKKAALSQSEVELQKQKFCEEMYDWMREQIYQKRVKPD